MDKFWQIASTFVWQKNSIFIAANGVNISTHQKFDPLGYEPSTCEEFTAAAMQAIKKLKAQGIDIGTDWLPKWEPKVGEVVCAWDNHRCEGLIVARFVSRGDGSFPYKLSNHYVYKHIAPFTGEIPEPFKSRWEAESDDPA